MAFGSSTISSAGGAVSDLFNAEGYRYKARGAQFEKENYDLAAKLADQNAQYTEWTTNVKAQMADRTTYQALGTINATIGGSGLKASGSALDLLHESAANGQLNKEVLIAQGQITEAGHQEQAESYRNMSKAAQVAIEADNEAATGAEWSAAFKGVSAIASIFTGGFGGGGAVDPVSGA